MVFASLFTIISQRIQSAISVKLHFYFNTLLFGIPRFRSQKLPSQHKSTLFSIFSYRYTQHLTFSYEHTINRYFDIER